MKKLSMVLLFVLGAACGNADAPEANEPVVSTQQELAACGPAPLVIPQKPGGGCKAGYGVNPRTGCCVDRR